MTQIHRSALAVIVILLLATSGRAAFQHSGPDVFIASGGLQFTNTRPIARCGTGDFIVVWRALGDGDQYASFGQRFESDGSPLGPPIQLNAEPSASQFFPSAAAAADCSFVAVWEQRDLNPPGPEINGPGDIEARRFDSLGTPLGVEFTVNSTTAGAQFLPHVASAPDGRFVVVWVGEDDGDGVGSFGQLYDAGGTPVGTEFQVNTYTTGGQEATDVAMRTDGSFVIAFSGGAAVDSDVFLREYDSTGTPLGPEFVANDYTTGSQIRPSLAMHTDGSFVVVWEDQNVGSSRDGDGNGIFGRAFDAAASPTTTDFQVNTYTTGEQSYPQASSHGDGNFAVVWENTVESRIGRLDASGNPLGGETIVTTDGPGKYVHLAAATDGSALATFRSGEVVARQLFCDDGGSCIVDDGCAGVVGGERIKIVLKRINTDVDPGNDTLRFSGNFTLPNGVSPAILADTFGTDVRIVLKTAGNTVISDDLLSGTYPLWRTNRKESKFRYKDKLGTINGIVLVQLKRLTRIGEPEPDRMSVKLKAKDGSFPVANGDEPLSITLELQGAATCGPETLAPTSCMFRGDGSTLKCE